MSWTGRTWHPAEGTEWPLDTRQRFEALMRAAAAKRRGQSALVDAWCTKRWVCWYSARNRREEVALRDQCRKLFGARERVETEKL